ncbi:MAG: hypothetical protein RI907_1646, partial [Pseudomonadota bacterium]
QLDAIIDKFMDYARPGEVELMPVHVSSVVDKSISQFRDTKRIRITAKLPIDTKVMADETELSRVLTNLFENARRYGRNTYTGVTNVDVSYMRSGAWVILSVRDHGPGVAPEKLSQLTTPFFPVTQHARLPRVPAWAWPSWTRPCSAWAAASSWRMRPAAG